MSQKPARPGVSTVDVLDRVLDKGIVVDIAAEISLLGLDLVGIEAQIVVASVQTYIERTGPSEGARVPPATASPPRSRAPARRRARARGAGHARRRARADQGASPLAAVLRCASGCTFAGRSVASRPGPATVGCPFRRGEVCRVTPL
jgi:hypothetical protein